MLLNMESVYHIVTIRVNETFWAHVWRLRSRYLGMGYDIGLVRVPPLPSVHLPHDTSHWAIRE
jgi:hypothetical protein